jgi:hypothetical protein
MFSGDCFGFRTRAMEAVRQKPKLCEYSIAASTTYVPEDT